MENNNPTKKIILTAIIALIVAGIGIFGWMVYMGKAGVVGEKIRTFLPFGNGGEDRPVVIPTTNTETNGGMIVGENGQLVSLLRKLHNAPVAGVSAFTKRAAGTTTQDVVVRYIERGLGHIYETNMSTLKEERISNETRLKVYDALWGNAGNSVAIRYLNGDKNDTIQTYSMVLRDIKNTTTTEEGRRVESDGVFLPENISEVAVSQEKDNRLFYLLPTGDSSVGITVGFDGKKQVQVFDSPLKEWLPFWPNDKLITLTTKPSQNVPGFMFFLDTQTGKTTKILGRISGLTTLTSSDGKNVLYSESKNGGLGLYVYGVAGDVKTKLSLATLPDKCAWSKLKKGVLYCGVPQVIPPGSLPDGWYQGATSFSDDMWMIDITTGITTMLVSPSKIAGEEIDATKLLLSPDESFLLFVNKKDSAPWSLKLIEP